MTEREEAFSLHLAEYFVWFRGFEHIRLSVKLRRVIIISGKNRLRPSFTQSQCSHSVICDFPGHFQRMNTAGDLQQSSSSYCCKPKWVVTQATAEENDHLSINRLIRSWGYDNCIWFHFRLPVPLM